MENNKQSIYAEMPIQSRKLSKSYVAFESCEFHDCRHNDGNDSSEIEHWNISIRVIAAIVVRCHSSIKLIQNWSCFKLHKSNVSGPSNYYIKAVCMLILWRGMFFRLFEVTETNICASWDNSYSIIYLNSELNWMWHDVRNARFAVRPQNNSDRRSNEVVSLEQMPTFSNSVACAVLSYDCGLHSHSGWVWNPATRSDLIPWQFGAEMKRNENFHFWECGQPSPTSTRLLENTYVVANWWKRRFKEIHIALAFHLSVASMRLSINIFFRMRFISCFHRQRNRVCTVRAMHAYTLPRIAYRILCNRIPVMCDGGEHVVYTSQIAHAQNLLLQLQTRSFRQ